MYKDQMEALEQDMLPFGIIDDGQENETIVDSEGTRWGVVETQRNYL